MTSAPRTDDAALSRRRAIQLTAGLGATCAAGGLAAVEPARRFPLAVKYHMIQTGGGVAEKLSVLASAGFDGVEISMREPSEGELEELRGASEQTGVKVHGVVRGSSRDYRPAIQRCARLGGSAVLVVAAEQPGLSYQQNFRQAQAAIRRSLPTAQEHGVQLLVENVRATFLKRAAEMARFLDELDSPLVGAYFDTGNAITWTEESAEHWARVLGHRIVKLDIKDRGHGVFGDPQKRSADAVGTDGGEVHWQRVRDELAAIGFDGWATAEVRGGGPERLRAMAGWMRQVLGMPDA